MAKKSNAKFVQCPNCTRKVKTRGLKNHMRFAHNMKPLNTSASNAAVVEAQDQINWEKKYNELNLEHELLKARMRILTSFGEAAFKACSAITELAY